MEYYYSTTLFKNSTNGSSSSSSTVRGHNGHSSAAYPAASAWETTPPAGNNIPDPNLTVLKLGKRHYFPEEGEEELEDPADVPPPKNGKAYPAVVVPRCQVEGCDSALLSAKEYHRRHKVCQVHAKAPTVLLLGIQQRFCQQCSRFHALAEFDDSKRSCRRRLAGHNRRRRKTSQEHHSQGGQTHLLNSSSECALSLLSSSTNYHPWSIPPQSDDLPARCSAALRELIAENRASMLAHRHINESSNIINNTYKHGFLSRDGLGPRGSVGHVTLDLMQDPGSAFGLLSVHGRKPPREGNEEDCSELWRVPLGY